MKRNFELVEGGAGRSIPVDVTPSLISGPTLERVALRVLSAPIHLHSPSAGRVGDQRLCRPLPYWPAMLSREQLCDYLGVSWSTLKSVLTVPPVDLGANVIRYRRDQIDEWVKSRPPRFGKVPPGPEAPASEAPSPDTRLRAMERARERANGR